MTASPTQIEASPRPSSVKAYMLNAAAMNPAGWNAYVDLIEPVMEHQHEYTIRNLIDSVRNGDMQAWAIVDDETDLVVGSMATRVVQYESGMTACIIVACSTDNTKICWESMRGVVRTVEHFAEDNECDIVRIMGRPGWARVFDDYNTTYVCIDKCVQGVSS